MLLRIPTIGDDAGPDYATNINYDLLSLIDTHDHTPGKGVALTTASLDIDTNLSFNSHFAIDVAGLTLVAQSSTPTVGTVYRISDDLYYVDGVGNVVRITQSGAVTGPPGTIAGLVSPASATYVPGSQTFVWRSNTNIAANLDAGTVLYRDLSPNSTYAISLQAPAALSSNYTLTLPTVPASNSFAQLNSSGALVATIPIAAGLTTSNISASANIIGSQLSASANILGSQLSASAGIVNGQIADHTLTSFKMVSTGVAAATYTAPTLTVDEAGRITAASDGTAYGASFYTPTITNLTNISSATASAAWQYMRIGSTVTLSGIIAIVTSGAGIYGLQINSPIVGSNFTTIGNAAGSAMGQSSFNAGVAYANVGSTRLVVTGTGDGAGAFTDTIMVNLTYRVL